MAKREQRSGRKNKETAPVLPPSVESTETSEVNSVASGAVVSESSPQTVPHMEQTPEEVFGVPEARVPVPVERKQRIPADQIAVDNFAPGSEVRQYVEAKYPYLLVGNRLFLSLAILLRSESIKKGDLSDTDGKIHVAMTVEVADKAAKQHCDWINADADKKRRKEERQKQDSQSGTANQPKKELSLSDAAKVSIERMVSDLEYLLKKECFDGLREKLASEMGVVFAASLKLDPKADQATCDALVERSAEILHRDQLILVENLAEIDRKELTAFGIIMIRRVAFRDDIADNVKIATSDRTKVEEVKNRLFAIKGEIRKYADEKGLTRDHSGDRPRQRSAGNDRPQGNRQDSRQGNHRDSRQGNDRGEQHQVGPAAMQAALVKAGFGTKQEPSK